MTFDYFLSKDFLTDKNQNSLRITKNQDELTPHHMAALYGQFRMCPAILSNWQIQRWLIYEQKLTFFLNHCQIWPLKAAKWYGVIISPNFAIKIYKIFTN